MSETNRNEDWAIISARKALMDAQGALAAKPSPYAALEVQDKKRRWDTMRKLELVKRAADEERS